MIKLFIVDDDKVYLNALTLQFQALGNFEVFAFSTGEACIDALGQGTSPPGVIILDYQLSLGKEKMLSGIETLDRIKEADPSIPVIMLSVEDQLDVALTCMHHQAFDFVVKSDTAFMRLERTIVNSFIYRKLGENMNSYIRRL